MFELKVDKSSTCRFVVSFLDLDYPALQMLMLHAPESIKIHTVCLLLYVASRALVSVTSNG